MKNKLIIYAWYIGAITAIVLGIASCGTIKKTTTSAVAVTETQETQTTQTATKITETKSFGDTLSGGGFLPFFPPQSAQPDSAGSGASKAKDTTQSLTAESNGLNLTINVTPRRDAAGNVNGANISYQAIAKPTAITTTQEQSGSTTKTKGSKKATAAQNSTVDAKAGWSVPAWGWGLIAIIVVIAVILFKRYLNPLKTLFKKPPNEGE